MESYTNHSQMLGSPCIQHPVLQHLREAPALAALLETTPGFVCTTNPVQANNLMALWGKKNLKNQREKGSRISFWKSINKSVMWKAQEVIILLYLVLVRAQLEYSAHFWAPTHKKDVDKLEWVQKRTTRMIRCFENVI